MKEVQLYDQNKQRLIKRAKELIQQAIPLVNTASPKLQVEKFTQIEEKKLPRLREIDRQLQKFMLEDFNIESVLELVTEAITLLGVCQTGLNAAPISNELADIETKLRQVRDNLIELL